MNFNLNLLFLVLSRFSNTIINNTKTNKYSSISKHLGPKLWKRIHPTWSNTPFSFTHVFYRKEKRPHLSLFSFRSEEKENGTRLSLVNSDIRWRRVLMRKNTHRVSIREEYSVWEIPVVVYSGMKEDMVTLWKRDELREICRWVFGIM